MHYHNYLITVFGPLRPPRSEYQRSVCSVVCAPAPVLLGYRDFSIGASCYCLDELARRKLRVHWFQF